MKSISINLSAVVLSICGLLATLTASSATFTVDFCTRPADASDADERDHCDILLRGPIEKGDAKRLLSIMRRPLANAQYVQKLVLDSPGGDIEEAIALSRVVRTALLGTSTFGIPRGGRNWFHGTCLSACFLVWIGGVKRSEDQDRPSIGLHRPRLSGPSYEDSPQAIADSHRQADEAVRSYLLGEHVPAKDIEAMMNRASTDIYWLEYRSWLRTEDEEIPYLAPWYEEMMIARCHYDPVAEKAAYSVLDSVDIRLPPSMWDKEVARASQWLVDLDRCERQLRINAQEAVRRP